MVCRKMHRGQKWVARNPPGFGFLIFDDRSDAAEAVQNMQEKYMRGYKLTVEYAKKGPRGGEDKGVRCHRCGKVGHIGYDCPTNPPEKRGRRRFRYEICTFINTRFFYKQLHFSGLRLKFG